jgi:hypothetical protein
MKILLEKVKIYGYDPNVFKTFTNNGVETKQYSVGLYISEEQKFLIDSYIYGKCETTKDGEILFYGKNKQQIPVFDQNKQKIEKPVNEVFLADVSILIDEFTDKQGSQVRYSKCLGIRYVSPVANEAVRVIVHEKYETYEDIFDEDKTELEIQKNDPAPGLVKKEDYASRAPKLEPVVPEETIYDPTAKPDDLPF